MGAGRTTIAAWAPYALVAVSVLISACAPRQQAPEMPPTAHPVVAIDTAPAGTEAVPTTTANLDPMIRLALADAASRSQLEQAQLTVVSANRVTWPNGSRGCPRPGMMYTQALVPGYLIVIDAAGKRLSYHGSENHEPSFCPADRVTRPGRDPRG